MMKINNIVSWFVAAWSVHVNKLQWYKIGVHCPYVDSINPTLDHHRKFSSMCILSEVLKKVYPECLLQTHC